MADKPIGTPVKNFSEENIFSRGIYAAMRKETLERRFPQGFEGAPKPAQILLMYLAFLPRVVWNLATFRKRKGPILRRLLGI